MERMSSVPSAYLAFLDPPRLRESGGKRARREAVLIALDELGYEPKSIEVGSTTSSGPSPSP